MINVPGSIALEDGQQPFYLIGQKGYQLETLQELPYETWATVSCVGVEIPLDHEWISQPLLLTTTYGGIVVETRKDGRFKIVSKSSQRSFESAIVGLHKLSLPMMEESMPVGAKVLPSPDEETIGLLTALKDHRLTLNQYLGCSSVSMKRDLIPYDGIVVVESWLPRFKDLSNYNQANVVLSGRDESGRERVAVSSYNSRNGKLESPIEMLL